MARQQLVTVGQSAALLISPEILAQIKVHVGDEVDIAIVNHTLILRSLEEAERQQQLEAVIDQVFTRRQNAYQRLAQG